MKENEMWNEAYERGENICFYPHEEIVRFLNAYVRKRQDVDKFENIMSISKEEWQNFASLDLGCGMGRHVVLLDEFGLNPYGIDLSESAIQKGKEWLHAIGKDALCNNLIVGSVEKLPFEDDFFQACVSHGTLDSMPRNVAINGIKEVHRVLKPGALMYLDLVMNTENELDGDVVFESGFAEGTTRSFFTFESMQSFLEEYFEIVEMKVISWSDAKGKEYNKRAHIVVKNR